VIHVASPIAVSRTWNCPTLHFTSALPVSLGYTDFQEEAEAVFVQPQFPVVFVATFFGLAACGVKALFGELSTRPTGVFTPTKLLTPIPNTVATGGVEFFRVP